MYSVIIVEDDPMVASINRQYVELEPSFSVKQSFKSGQDALFLAEQRGGGSDYPGLLHATDDRKRIY